MTTEHEILDAALSVLRRGDALTIDAVARDADLTKPGVVHHFASKKDLTLAVLDHLLDQWEAQLQARVGDDAGSGDWLRAYAEHTLLSDMDAADLALLADPRLRESLSTRWTGRMRAWFGDSRDPRLVAARLIADGAWIDRCLGMLDLDQATRLATANLVAELIEEGAGS